MCTHHLPVPQPSFLTHHHKGHMQRAEPSPLCFHTWAQPWWHAGSHQPAGAGGKAGLWPGTQLSRKAVFALVSCIAVLQTTTHRPKHLWEQAGRARRCPRLQKRCKHNVLKPQNTAGLLVATEDSATLIKSNPETQHSGPILFSLAKLKGHRPFKLKGVKEVLMATGQMHGPCCKASFEHIHFDPVSCKILGILCIQEHPSLCACKKPQVPKEQMRGSEFP